MDGIDNRRGQYLNSPNRKFYRQNFTGVNLSDADFRGASLLECNFTGADLSRANFSGANCYRSVFKDARLYKANFKDANLTECNLDGAQMFDLTITLNCEAFSGVKMSDKWLHALLYFVSMIEMSPEMKAKINDIIGDEQREKLRSVFQGSERY